MKPELNGPMYLINKRDLYANIVTISNDPPSALVARPLTGSGVTPAKDNMSQCHRMRVLPEPRL